MSSLPPQRLRASWALVRTLVLAVGFCVLYVAVDLRLADAPAPAVTWPPILAGAAVWVGVTMALGRAARAEERTAGGDRGRERAGAP